MTIRARTAPSDLGTQKKKRRQRRRRTDLSGVVILAVALLHSPHWVGAQTDDYPFFLNEIIGEALFIEDLGVTQRLNSGARSAGMAGAYSSMGEDVHSLIYNPGGLARIRRIDMSLGVSHSREQLETKFYGSDNNLDAQKSHLDLLAAAYPVPTYRGSFVLAAGIYRVFSSDIDLLNRGINTDTATFDDYSLQQSGSIYSYNIGFGMDVSRAFSAGVTGYVMDGKLEALTQTFYEFTDPLQDGELSGESSFDQVDADVDGLGAMAGIHFHPHPLTQFGLTVTSPTAININGTGHTERIEYYQNSVDSAFNSSGVIDVDYTIPWRFDAGVSFRPKHFLVNVDLSYSDWTRVTTNSVQLKDENFRPFYRKVMNVRAGLEATMPKWPLRVRAGYAYLPYPLEYLQSDRIDSDPIAIRNNFQRATVKQERQIWALGAGGLFGKFLTVDAAYEFHLGERSLDTLVDKRTSQHFLLSGSYRF